MKAGTVSKVVKTWCDENRTVALKKMVAGVVGLGVAMLGFAWVCEYLVPFAEGLFIDAAMFAATACPVAVFFFAGRNLDVVMDYKAHTDFGRVRGEYRRYQVPDVVLGRIADDTAVPKSIKQRIAMTLDESETARITFEQVFAIEKEHDSQFSNPKLNASSGTGYHKMMAFATPC